MDMHVTTIPTVNAIDRKEYDRLCVLASAKIGTEVHPSQVYAPECAFTGNESAAELDCVSVFNTSQLHQCRPGGCHMHRETDRCRFHFPRELVDHTDAISKHDRHRRHLNIRHQRFHQWINPCNKAIAVAFRSNTDCKLVGNASGLAAYISTYVTKGETEGQQLMDTMCTAIGQLSLDTTQESVSQQIKSYGIKEFTD